MLWLTAYLVVGLWASKKLETEDRWANKPPHSTWYHAAMIFCWFPLALLGLAMYLTGK